MMSLTSMPLKQQRLVLAMAKRRKTTPKKRVLRAVNNIDDKAGRLAALILVKKNAENEKKLAIAESEKKLAESEKTLAIAEKKLAIAEIEKSRIHERLLQCAGLLTARGIVERFAQLAYHEQLKARHIKGNFVCTHALVEAVKNPDAGPWSTFLSTSMQECVEKKGLDAPCEVAKVWKDLSEAVHGCPWYGPDVLLISSLNDIGKCLVRKLAAHFGLNVVEKAPELYMPVAYILRLTDAHHVLAGVAKEAGVTVPAMPGGSFNPCSSMVQSVDTTRSAKAPEAWKSQAESLRDEVKKRERELREEVEQAPEVALRPAAFWLSAGRRLDEVIREAEQDSEERTSDGHLLKEQVASAKQALSGNHTFESADKKRLAQLQRAKAHQSCVLRIICPDKSVLQVHFRSAEKGEKVLEAIRPLFSETVQTSKWYVYRSPPMERMNPKASLLASGLAPGAVMYLGFDGEKCGPPFLRADLLEQLGPCREESGVTAPSSFTGEAMGWGAGQRLGSQKSATAATAASAPAEKAQKIEGEAVKPE
eukprot:symbB.v1.2.012009.t1/scaffold769.1/size163963/13